MRSFESDPSGKEKCYINVAYPYPSGAMHVGHGRTYIVPDVIARFWRMRGRQVLYPMAFHVTGSPVIGISKRIARGDEQTISLYRDVYNVPRDILSKFSDPLAIVEHFSDEYERVMRRVGLSIDWRRRFTTIIPQYSKFIEWQFHHLYLQNRVVKGEHPVKYCPQCENPVGDHDLLEGDAAEIVKFIFVHFQADGFLIPCATLRPETIYGVTNLWINPGVRYVTALVDGTTWLLSREAADKLALQKHDVEITGEMAGSDLVDTTVTHPLSGEVRILPADFVDPDMGSGIVMSVPAHAPYDYIALADLQADGLYTDIKPVPLIRVDGYGEIPAMEAVLRRGIKNQLDPAMDEITQEVYAAEFSRGKLLPLCGVHAGKSVRSAREDLAEVMEREYESIWFYDFDQQPVVCRCGSRAYVRILDDQWFLTYSDPEWKREVHDQVEKVAFVPPEVRVEFDRTVDWLKDWACTRRVGLGTKVPWDPDWLIEPLSDSTVYMAYYTIAHKISAIPAEKLTPAVFDYIFLGRGNPEGVEQATLDELRAEFLYWYPYDYRFSAKDLISNHLTFQLFHHRAIFPDELQPKGMVVFGMGLLDGAKMSSSKGNVFLLDDAADEFGADTVRMFLVGSAEPWQDFDWRNELVLSTKKQIERFVGYVNDHTAHGDGGDMDHWLASRLQQRIARTTEALELFQTRQALQEAYFGIESDLKWYRRRLPANTPGGAVLRDVASAWVRLLAPIIPFTCEELWQGLGESGSVSFAEWPVSRPDLIRPDLELAEELTGRTIEDIESIQKILPITPEKVTLFLAPEWKLDVFRKVATAADPRMVTKELMKDEAMRTRGKDAVNTITQVTKLIHSLPPQLVASIQSQMFDEHAIFTQAAAFLEEEFSVAVDIQAAEESSHPKAKMALPFKPAIVVE
ncbi:MAG: leucine--tRNA ligase [Methanocalculus sp. MSAO_Arc1]|uniref:leucine--tRNA ligase n=1 Tax=Methanocalculus TaxID=71151 RepID=UPI000FF527DE|nr:MULTISPECIES: leucine--tRNA ligase [unclassified Methanocalculus]RQD79610.1 MAG: leucine--tRNA ligase [Methanocalculus sp. MSAO_Arc1]